MGTYAELFLACDLKKDIPQEVIDALDYICEPNNEKLDALVKPDHWFFQLEDWQEITGEQWHLPGGNLIASFVWSGYEGFYRFTFRTNIKGGDPVITAFVHWLAPYSNTEGFVGYTQSPATSPSVDLIYFLDDEAYYDAVSYDETPPTVKRYKITQAEGENYYKLLPVDFT